MIVAGFGCRAAASPEALRAALDAALAAARIPLPMLAGLAVPADRQARLESLAVALGLPLSVVDADALHAQTTITRSPRSQAARGCGSVAEAAALAAAGEGARLLATRHISPDRSATCAIAQGESS